MDTREFIRSRDDGIDAFVEHSAPFKLTSDGAHAIGVLGMLFQSEMFSKSIVVRNEHVVAFMSTLLARGGFTSSRL
jgi:hypothetical protein